MAEESDITELLGSLGGEGSLDEISEALGIPKYGPDSAYTLLRALRSKGIVDRKGEKWELVAREAARPSVPTETKKEEGVAAPVPAQPAAPAPPASNVEQIIEAMSKTLRSAMSGLREPSDEWELAKKPMETYRKEEGRPKPQFASTRSGPRSYEASLGVSNRHSTGQPVFQV